MSRHRILWTTFLLLSTFFLVPSLSLFAQERRTALVIGNANYESSPLANPVNDANDIAKALRNLGFIVIHKKNATQREMEKAVREFGKTLRKHGGVGLFYYAGHGIQVNGRNYLIPVDAEIETESDVKFEAVDAGRVLGKMEDADNDLNIVILDACRDNPFARSFRSSTQGLARMDAPRGSIIAYATAPGSVAADGGGRNGVFTKYLLKHMNTPGLPIEDVLKNVRTDVLDESNERQIPWESSSLTGNFYFNSGRGIAVRKRPTTEPEGSLREEKAGLERERRELERLRTEIERQKLESERKRLQAEKKRLEAASLANKPSKASTKPLSKRTGVPDNRTWTDPVTGMEFVWVPKGCFEMGCGSWTSDCSNNEKPVHEVCLDGFWMGKHEVTQGQWKKIMGSNPSYKKGDTYPVEEVSWDDAQEFISKLNAKGNGKHDFRLPTEAEWEYACRSGGKPEKYAGGSDVYRLAWYVGNSGHSSHPVGTKKPNGIGLYDMSGNVLEWCEDWYGKYSSASLKNPKGPSEGRDRVIRGGSWYDSQGSARCADRNGFHPDSRHTYLGFRLVRTP